MTDAAMPQNEETPKKGKKGLIFGVLGAVILGGAAFFVTYTGIFPSAGGDSEIAADSHGAPVDDGHGASDEGEHGDAESKVTFIALDPVVISLGKFASSRYLHFQAYLEVPSAAAEEVEHLSPRVLDVLNTYLRAISESELEDPTSMNRLRAQMLRRVQVVVGEKNVRDLLITEFILN
ncbi:MAG: flagellar basal body-associated FliL family protein [Alphaproteobacteria bacterium]